MANTKIIGTKPRNSLRAFIVERGWRQQDLADAIGTSDSKLSRYLNGRLDLKETEKTALCRVLKVSRTKLTEMGG